MIKINGYIKGIDNVANRLGFWYMGRFLPMQNLFRKPGTGNFIYLPILLALVKYQNLAKHKFYQ